MNITGLERRLKKARKMKKAFENKRKEDRVKAVEEGMANIKDKIAELRAKKPKKISR